jgi:hypothetical protein
MKNLPGIDIDYSELYRSLYAPIRSKLLLTGIELKVFDELSEPASAEAVAQAITGHAENTRIFLDALVAADILQKKKGLYKNTPVAQAFLMDGSSTYLGTLFTGLSQRMLGGLDDLSALIKKGSGPSPEDADMGSGEMWAQFAGPMANYARAAGRKGSTGRGDHFRSAGIFLFWQDAGFGRWPWHSRDSYYLSTSGYERRYL